MNKYWVQLAKYGVRRAILRSPLRGFRPYQGAKAEFGADLVRSWRQRELIVSLSFQRAIASTRGTFLGPFWIALSFMIVAVGLSALWAYLFNRPFNDYLPYLTLGFFVWNLFIGAVTTGARALIANKNLVLQTRTPMTLYSGVALGANLITAAHHIPFVVTVLLLYHSHFEPAMLLSLLGMVLVLLTALGAAIALSIWCAYLPDLAELISTSMRFIMFFTPILWMPDRRPSLQPFLLGNPFYHVINVVRGPLIGSDHIMISFIAMGGICAAVWALAAIIYWSAAGAVATRLQ